MALIFKKVPPTQEERDKWEAESKAFVELMKIPFSERPKEPERPEPTDDEIENRNLEAIEGQLVLLMEERAPDGAGLKDLEYLITVFCEYIERKGTGRNSSTRCAKALPTSRRLKNEWGSALDRLVAKGEICITFGKTPERFYAWNCDFWGLELIEPVGETNEEKEIIKLIPKETVKMSEILAKSPYTPTITEQILKKLNLRGAIISRLAPFEEEA